MALVLNPGYIASVEYIEETVYGTLPTNPAMVWVGGVTSFKDKSKTRSASAKYLLDDDDTLRAEAFIHAKTGEEAKFDMTYYPQDLPGLLEYAMGSDTGVADVLTSFSLGIIHNKTVQDYYYYSGCVVDEFTLTIPDDGFVTCDISCTAADKSTLGSSDYIGTGSHADSASDDPLSSEDVSLIQMDTGGGYAVIDDAVSEIVLKISNKVGYARDLAETSTNRVKGQALTSREMTLELTMDYDDFDMLTHVRALTELGFKFALTDGVSTWTFTVSGVRFPEMPYEYGQEDLIGDKLTSLQCTNLVFAETP